MAFVPLIAKAAIVASLATLIWWSLFGPPPEHRDVGAARLWGATALVLCGAGLYAVFTGHRGAPFLVGLGVMALCLAFWHARGGDDDGGGGGGESDDDDGDGPLDWDEFDRARHDWERPLLPS